MKPKFLIPNLNLFLSDLWIVFISLRCRRNSRSLPQSQCWSVHKVFSVLDQSRHLGIFGFVTSTNLKISLLACSWGHYCQIRDISNRLLERPQNVPKITVESPTSKVGHVGDIRTFCAWFVRDGIRQFSNFHIFIFFLIFFWSILKQISLESKHFILKSRQQTRNLPWKTLQHFSVRVQTTTWWRMRHLIKKLELPLTLQKASRSEDKRLPWKKLLQDKLESYSYRYRKLYSLAWFTSIASECFDCGGPPQL